MEADRFEAEEPAIILYDLDTHAVKKKLALAERDRFAASASSVS